jgi:hypothetical protein
MRSQGRVLHPLPSRLSDPALARACSLAGRGNLLSSTNGIWIFLDTCLFTPLSNSRPLQARSPHPASVLLHAPVFMVFFGRFRERTGRPAPDEIFLRCRLRHYRRSRSPRFRLRFSENPEAPCSRILTAARHATRNSSSCPSGIDLESSSVVVPCKIAQIANANWV